MSKITEALKKAAAEREARAREARASGAPFRKPAPAAAVGKEAAQRPQREETRPAQAAESGAEPGQAGAAPLTARLRSQGFAEKLLPNLPDPSPAVSQIRLLRVGLEAAFDGRLPGLVIVAGADETPCAGLVGLNLAYSIERYTGKPTAVVDMDFLSPTFLAGFELDGVPGVLSVLEEGMDPARCGVKAESARNLTVFSAGTTGPVPTELLGGPRAEEFIGWLRRNFDHVVVVAPGVLAAPETAVLGRLADGVVLAVEAGVTRREVVERAAEELADAEVKLVGVALSEVEYVVPEAIYRRL